MFKVSEKASEKIKAFFSEGQEPSPVRVVETGG